MAADVHKPEVEGSLACCGAIEEKITHISIMGTTYRFKGLSISTLDLGRKGGRRRGHGDGGEAEVAIAALSLDALHVWVGLDEGVGFSLERHGCVKCWNSNEKPSRFEIRGSGW